MAPEAVASGRRWQRYGTVRIDDPAIAQGRPDMADATIVGDHEIGAFALRYFATIRKRKRPRGIERRQPRCARKPLRVGLGEFQHGGKDGGGMIVRGQYVQQARPMGVAGGEIPRIALPTQRIGCLLYTSPSPRD